MNKLIVLCGPVGSGKTTLAQAWIKQYPVFLHVDIFDFIKEYKDANGHMTAAASLAAHQKLYKHLESVEGDILLEIGTNRHELNMTRIASLQNRFSTHVIFCLLDSETCISRVWERAAKQDNRKISKENLEEKLKRVFPDNHIRISKALRLPHFILDMSMPLAAQKEFVLKTCKK